MSSVCFDYQKADVAHINATRSTFFNRKIDFDPRFDDCEISGSEINFITVKKKN